MNLAELVTALEQIRKDDPKAACAHVIVFRGVLKPFYKGGVVYLTEE